MVGGVDDVAVFRGTTVDDVVVGLQRDVLYRYIRIVHDFRFIRLLARLGETHLNHVDQRLFVCFMHAAIDGQRVPPTERRANVGADSL